LKKSETNSQSKPSLLKALNRVPPFFIYYAAGLGNLKKGSHPRIEGIAERSGLSPATVERLSSRMTWADVTFGTMAKFCEACGASFVKESAGKIYLVFPGRRYLRDLAKGLVREPFRHLSKRQKVNFEKRCMEWDRLKNGPDAKPD
jgi:hypothetical protein